MPVIAIALIVAAALGGGVSVAAQNTVPGDALYGFKVHVNEGVESALAVTAQDKAKVDIALTQERLDEARQLAAKGTINAQIKGDLSANLSEHAQDISTQIAKLQAAGDFADAATIAAKFQGTLAAESSLGTVISTINAELDHAASLSAEASAKAASHTDATANDETTGQSDTSANAPVHGLRIRTDGDANASSSDTDTEGSLDGTVHVNTY